MNFHFVLINRLIHPTFVNKERLYLNHTVTYWRLGDEKTSMWNFKLIIIQGVSKKNCWQNSESYAASPPKSHLYRPFMTKLRNVCFWPFLREGLNEKNVFFRALPELPNPPPPMTPIQATWSSFFGIRNSRFESQFRTKNKYIFYVIYCIYAT